MKGHILIVADGRSPTALSWIENIQSLGYRVSLISTFPCKPPENLAHFRVIPIAFSKFSRQPDASGSQPRTSVLRTLVKRFLPLFQSLRYVLGPMTLPRYEHIFLQTVEDIQPDLVHALRIPFEGMLGQFTPPKIPFLAATWGNDLTLHAQGSSLMRRWTRRCLQRADGLSSDTHRDVRLAQEWGLSASAFTLVVPGSGGLELEAIRAAKPFNNNPFGIPSNGPRVVNPRGLRPGSVHQDVFFAAIPDVLDVHPGAVFICPGLAGIRQVEAWVDKFDIQQQTFLLPPLTQEQLWALFADSALFVSPSSHDGTPNTLLEAMASGCFPVVGDIESLREWITNEENGILVDPQDPDKLAGAIITALNNRRLRLEASERNLAIIEERAAKSATLPQIDAFYTQFLK